MKFILPWKITKCNICSTAGSTVTVNNIHVCSNCQSNETMQCVKCKTTILRLNAINNMCINCYTGSFKECDMCTIKFPEHELQLYGNGFMSCKKCYESRFGG